jgi:hypothetical protein
MTWTETTCNHTLHAMRLGDENATRLGDENSSEYYIICIFNYYNIFNVREYSAKFAEHLF